mgnify:CR=1 FL=1
MDIGWLPPINAVLNGIAAILLTWGYRAVRRKDVELHKKCMVGAFMVSAAFLACYLTYHFLKSRATGQAHTTFTGQGLVRPIYFFILITHIVLAVVNLPMVLMTLYRAYRGQFERHRRLAKWTWPIWMYVSVTGVVVYVMLYHLYPASA